MSNLIIFFLHDHFILTDQLMINSLSDRFTAGQIRGMMDTMVYLQYLAYPILLITISLKMLAIAAVLYMGYYLTGLAVNYSQLLKAVCMAETLFLIPLTWKLLWFCFQNSYTFSDVEQFYPLSLLNLFNAASLETWWIYPLQVSNIFELGYILLLAVFIPAPALRCYDHSLRMVLSTYLPALLVWTVIVMFITLVTASK